jgi:hypothetical protein
MNGKNEGLSLGYRLRWRLSYMLLNVAGPATLSAELDPRCRMRRDRAARVARAQQEREVRTAPFPQVRKPRTGVLQAAAQSDGVRPGESRRAASPTSSRRRTVADQPTGVRPV